MVLCDDQTRRHFLWFCTCWNLRRRFISVMQFYFISDVYTREDSVVSRWRRQQLPFKQTGIHGTCFFVSIQKILNSKLKFTWPSFLQLVQSLQSPSLFLLVLLVLLLLLLLLFSPICEHMTSSPDRDENELKLGWFVQSRLDHLPKEDLTSWAWKKLYPFDDIVLTNAWLPACFKEIALISLHI